MKCSDPGCTNLPCSKETPYRGQVSLIIASMISPSTIQYSRNRLYRRTRSWGFGRATRTVQDASLGRATCTTQAAGKANASTVLLLSIAALHNLAYTPACP